MTCGRLEAVKVHLVSANDSDFPSPMRFGSSATGNVTAQCHTWAHDALKNPDDFNVDDFVTLLSTRPGDQPMTLAFEDAWAQERQRSTSDSGRWRHNQK